MLLFIQTMIQIKTTWLSKKYDSRSFGLAKNKVTLKMAYMVMINDTTLFKGRHGIGIKGNFESGEDKSKVCYHMLKDRECDPLFVTIDTSCKLYFKRDNVF